MDIAAMADDDWRGRLLVAIKDRDTSERALSLAIGRAPGYVNSILKNGKQPAIDKMVSIAERLGVSLSWLLYGIEMTADAEHLLRLYSGLNRTQKTDFLRLAESVAALAHQKGE